MSNIKNLNAIEILNSKGFPTLEVEIELESGVKTVASVPSGTSVGSHEAFDLRDQNEHRYCGFGVLNAAYNVNKVISKEIIGMNVLEQSVIDNTMIDLDHSERKSNLGGNAILAVSMAVARAAAIHLDISLHRYIGDIVMKSYKTIPTPLINVINGGLHADNRLSIQEFMIVPVKFDKFSENIRVAAEVIFALKKLLKKTFLFYSCW